MSGNTKKVFLIADDDQDVLSSLKLIIENHFENSSVYVAKDGSEALKKIQNVVPHVLITDLSMPKMSGNDLLMTITNAEKFKPFPVIIISGVCRDERYINEALTGRFRFLPKPFKSKQIISMVETLMEKPIDTSGNIEKRAIMEAVLTSIQSAIELSLNRTVEKGKPLVKPERKTSGDISVSIYFHIKNIRGLIAYCFKLDEYNSFASALDSERKELSDEAALPENEEKELHKVADTLKKSFEDNLLKSGLVLEVDKIDIKKEANHFLQENIETNTVIIPFKSEALTWNVEFNLY